MKLGLNAALDAVTRLENEENAVLCATVRGLLRGYDLKWADANWFTESVESEFRLPIINPDSGKPSRTFQHAGRFDGIVNYGGKMFLMEHKTCSEDIEDPNASYWRRLEIDAQVSGYVLAHWQLGKKLDGTMYDVIRKPGIRPKTIAAGDRHKIVAEGVYCGTRLDDATRQAVASHNGPLTESPAFFEMRVAHECSTEPLRYFQRRTVPRMDSQLLDYARELWQTADEIRLAKVNQRYYRNSGACMNFNRPCEFLGICSGHDSTDSDKWQKAANVHVELDQIPVTDSRSVLTHSSMSCFKTCKRKYELRYQLGLRKQDDEAEALYFGKIMHAGLAAWWSCQQPERVDHDDRNGSAGIESAECEANVTV